MFKFFAVGLLAEMKMRGNGVLEKMNQKKSDEDVKEGVLASQADGFRENFDKNYSQHVAGAECQEVLQEVAGPFLANDEIATEKIPGGSDEAEDGGQGDSKEFRCGHRLRGRNCITSLYGPPQSSRKSGAEPP